MGCGSTPLKMTHPLAWPNRFWGTANGRGTSRTVSGTRPDCCWVHNCLMGARAGTNKNPGLSSLIFKKISSRIGEIWLPKSLKTLLTKMNLRRTMRGRANSAFDLLARYSRSLDRIVFGRQSSKVCRAQQYTIYSIERLARLRPVCSIDHSLGRISMPWAVDGLPELSVCSTQQYTL